MNETATIPGPGHNLQESKTVETVRGQYHAEIDIPYSADHYRIQYRDSSGLDYKDGKIHKNYIRWVRLLDRDIVRDLKDNQNESTAKQLSEAALVKPL